MEHIELRPATDADIDTALSICSDARAFQRSSGFVQWADGYPSRDVIARDVALARGYMIVVDGRTLGYCVIDPAGDPEYDRYPELWAITGPYAAVHRLAFRAEARGRGLAERVFAIIEDMLRRRGIWAIKVDTGLLNRRMHRLMDALAFTPRGPHTFSWGPRLTFEKPVTCPGYRPSSADN